MKITYPDSFYPSILESIAEGIVVIGLDKKILFINKMAKELIGLQNDLTGGMSCEEVIRTELCSKGCPLDSTNNGHENSYGFGARVGYLGEVLPNIFLGASYQTKVYMSELDDYAGLFAEQGDFDIPSNWTVGLAVKLSPALTFAFDVQQIYYSDVNAVGNPMLPNLMTSQLGDDKGSGFGWEDMTVVKTGVQWQSSPDWTWRAGYSISDQPIPNIEMPFNILAPGVIEQHATVGFTKKLGSNQELDFTVTRAFSNDVEGPNTLDPAQTIELKMDQWEIALGYTYKF